MNNEASSDRAPDLQAVMAPRRACGHTLVELIIVVSVLTFLVGIIANLMVSTSQNQKYAERLSHALEMNQDVLNELRYELSSSVALFENDSLGAGYLTALDLDSSAPPIGTSVLPTIDSGGIFEKETSSGAKTGNALLFARQAWTTEFACISTATYRVDVYRIVHYYLKKEDAGPQPGSPVGLNLCKWVSEPMADGDQIDRITDLTDRAEVLQHLINQSPDIGGETYDKVELVWLRKDDLATVGTIRQIDPTFDLSDTPLLPRTSPWRILRNDQRSNAGLLWYRHFSIVTNHARASWGVGRFGLIDNTGDGFPHGLETQIVGPSSSRLVLLHVTIATTNGSGRKAQSDMRSTVFVQDVK